jgi:filamentous hemagglutinin family protein
MSPQLFFATVKSGCPASPFAQRLGAAMFQEISMHARFCAPARTRAALLTTTLLMSGILLSSQALAQTVLPSGGQVIAGAATINGSGSQTVISQSSDKAIINWTDFSIGQGGKVIFNNGAGTTLNRVTGSNLSSINGLLNATGSVYLINPNGVIIGKTGVVNVGGGFVTSALDITNDNFLSGGDLTFSGPSLASVVNLGKIGALGGDVALMAVNVQNSGTIDAANGTAGLLAGHKIIMRDSSVNDGRFLIVTGDADTTVTNDGAIAAASVELRAEGGNIYALAGNTSGVIRATGVSEKDGKVWLTAGTAGSVNMSGGTVAASAANGDGGMISVTGGQVKVTANATLDASATGSGGNGGTVKVIADMASGSLNFQGTARAGSLSGNGGFIETSGAAVDFNGARIDTASATGKSGNWLIDPYNLTIDASAATTISTNLASTNVTLQTTASGTSAIGTASSGDGDIIINSDITWASGNTLTLDAYHGITVNGNVTVAGAGGVILTTNDGGTGGDYNFTIGNGLNYTGAGGSLSINGSAYTLLYSLSDFSSMEGSTGKFALAKSLDATASSYTASVVANFGTSSNHTGIFTGLGNTITDLKITAYYGYTGLFGFNFGTIRDIGLVGGLIQADETGSLVGFNYSGVIKNAFSSATVMGGSSAGGLVETNSGVISNSFATGAVIGGWTAGGLVAANYNGSGIISNSYATGSVYARTQGGGLAGINNGGTIINSFATGALTGTGAMGGLSGSDNGGTITNSYYDSGTTGAVNGLGTTLTTAQLQGGLPTGFSTSAWATGTGLYPYLKTFYPGGLQVITGTAQNNSGGAASTAQLAFYTGGAQLGSATSGANGYYYFVAAPGTTTASTELGATLTLNGASGVSGLSYTNAPSLSGGNVVNFNIQSNLIDLTTGATSYSSLQSRLTAIFGNSALTSAMTGITNPDYKITTSGAFTLDTALTGGGAVSIKTGGDLTIDNAITVSGSKALTLDSHDNLYVNANLTASGSNAATLAVGNGGSGDYYFALGDSLSFTGSGGSLSINGDNYTLLYSLGDLAGIDGSANYALARSLDASGQTYSDALVAEIQTTFTGLGHTVSNLTVNSSNDKAGLFGYNSGSGTIRDIGVVGGSIHGASNNGGLLGLNSGIVLNAYSSANVSGNGDDIGGLVGFNLGSISNSFATGSAKGRFYVGGLVGLSDNGPITNAFATGSATAESVAGGLVGHLAGGTVDNVYATGYASGSNGLFGVVSSNALIVNAYYDTNTNTNNGIGYNDGSYSVTGLTTAQLQGSLPSGFSSSAWATGTGLYPYLKTFSPNGLQAFTGTMLDSNGEAVGAAQVALYTGGVQLGSASSGANGYYYFVTAPGTTTSSTELGATLTLNGASGVSGLNYTNAISLSGGNVGNFNIQSDLIDLTTGASSYSNLQSRLTATFGNSALTSALASLTHPDYKITANGAFNFDRALTTGGGLNATAAGGIILSANLTTGGAATFNSAVTLGRDVTLTSDNALAFHSTINGAHNLTLSGTSLDFAGAVGGTSALTSLTGTATAGDITVGGRITTTGAIRLAANGSFTNTAGATALNAGGGFTVYTQDAYDPTGTMPVNSFGGLTATNYYNDAYDFGTGTFASAVPTGDHFVYAYAASLTPILSGDATRTYNATTDADTTGLTVSGTLLSDNDSVTFNIDNASYDTKNAGTDKTITADISLSSNPNNYTLDSSTASAAIGTINQAALTLAAATGTKTYDTTMTSSGTVGISGLQGSDTVTGLSQSYDSKNAGSRTLGVNGGYVVNDGNGGGNYTVTTQTASGTIGKATLTAGLTGTVVKTYDATTDAGLTSTNYSLTGVLGSDDVALNDPTSGSYSDKNAGTGKSVSVSGLVLSGGDADNYTVNSTASGAIGTINKAALTLAAMTGTRTYDATTTSSGTVGVSGLQGSDTVTGLSQSYDSKNAGSRTLGVNGGYVVNDGNGGGNYTITTQTASGSINKATLVAGLTGTVEKTYDATTDANLTDANYTLTGMFGGDSVTLNGPASGSYADQNAGTGKTVSVSGLALSGEDAGNYTVNTSAFGAVGVIDRRLVTITADNIGKISGVNDPLLTWQMTLGSLAGNDTLTGGLSRATGENPGTYAITQGSLAASDNYTVTFIGAKFTITPAGMQNQPVVNPVQNSFAPPPPFSSFSDNSGPDSGSSGGNAGGSAPAATGPSTGDSPSSSTTCTDGGACANQPYPGNQSFSSYVSFLSH